LFGVHRIFLFSFLAPFISREKAEEEVAEDYFGGPGYGRSGGPT